MKRERKLASFTLFFHEKILNDKQLTTTERFLLALIAFRDSSPKGCFASNESLASYLNCSIPTISRTVAKLKDKGYIIISEPDEDDRGRSHIRKVREDLKKRWSDDK